MYKFCPFCGQSVKFYPPSHYLCESCGKSTYLNSKPTGSVIPVCGREILVSIRGIEPEKGKLDLIGGFLELGEDSVTGAVREFKEETGYDLDPNELKLISIETDNYLYQGNKIYTFNPVYWLDFSKGIKLIPADDVAELVWVSIDEPHDWAFDCIHKATVKLVKILDEN